MKRRHRGPSKFYLAAGSFMGLMLILAFAFPSTWDGMFEKTIPQQGCEAGYHRTNGECVPNTPGDPLDVFGIHKIYAVQAGREWYMNMVNPTSDGIFLSGQTGYIRADITKNPDGSWKVSGANYPESFRYQVRMIVDTPVGSEQWKNIEWTAYVKPIKTFGKQDWMPDESYNAIVLYNRGGIHSSAMPCDGSALKAGIELNGRTWFKKEIWHSGGYSASTNVKQSMSPLLTQVDPAGHYSGGSKWIGMKFMVYNINNDNDVKMEIWLDKNATNTWEKVNEYTDTGNWQGDRANFFDPNGDGNTSDACKDMNGAVKQRNHVINYAAPWASIRTDNMEFHFKNMSVRQIAVPGGSLSPGIIQTTPYTFGFTPFELFANEEEHNDAD